MRYILNHRHFLVGGEKIDDAEGESEQTPQKQYVAVTLISLKATENIMLFIKP